MKPLKHIDSERTRLLGEIQKVVAKIRALVNPHVDTLDQ